MELRGPLSKGKLIKRYKRFLADVELDNGHIITAHCPNSGSMAGLTEPGIAVIVSDCGNPARKLACTLEMVRPGAASWVGIHTGHTNALAAEAIAAGVIAELTGYDTVRREVKYGQNSRIDLLLESPGRPACYVEVKNVTLKRADMAEFPDAVTSRGAKHMLELAEMVRGGHRAVVLFIAQREDVEAFTIAADIDPVYAKALAEAVGAGVEVLCYRCSMREDAVTVERKLPVLLPRS